MYETDPEARKVIDVAKGLEGLRRQDGIHAAAVVITDLPLTEYLPVQRKPAAGQDPEQAPMVTQYEMHGVEDLGLLKMDFLGLRNLSVIENALDLIEGVTGERPDIDNVPLDDDDDPGHAVQGRLHRGVPVGGRPDAGPHALAGPRQLRRRGRPGGALPAGPDGGQHAQRLRRPEERAQAGHLLPPGRRGDAEGHLRPVHLPGGDDAPGPDLRRLLAGGGRQPPQGVRQEDPRAPGQGAGEVRRGLRPARATAPTSATPCSTPSSPSPTTPSTRATPTATAWSRTRRPGSRPTTRSSTWPPCSPRSSPTRTSRRST